MQRPIVAKFGGTSLADAGQVRKVIAIMRANPRRRAVVVSAPGKRHKDDTKVTDLLLAGRIADAIERYREIAEMLAVNIHKNEYEALYGLTGDHLVSRGEYLMGKLLALASGYTFVDPASFIRFDAEGRLDMEATKRSSQVLLDASPRGVVVPGFYGAMPNGSIKTFGRGGSDITGSVVAALLNAEVYENWTDVDGTLMSDPRVVRHPAKIKRMTYREMRELAYAGAGVLHDEAVFPVRKAGIPIHIRNTNRPRRQGTFILPDDAKLRRRRGSITGIAARKGFTVIAVEKAGMNSDIGYGCMILCIFRELGISWEHLPGSIDSLSIVVHSKELDGKLDAVLTLIEERGKPDKLSVKTGLALVCTVGLGMAQTPGVLAKLSTALARAGISIRMIDQGASEISIITGVDERHCDKAVRAIYSAFAKK